MQEISLTREFTLRANFDSYVDKLANVIINDYPGLLQLQPKEYAKAIAAFFFSELVGCFCDSISEESFLRQVTRLANTLALTGLLKSSDAKGFLAAVCKIVDECKDETQKLLEKP